MSVFHPTAEEVEEAVLRLRHEGTAEGATFHYGGPMGAVPADKLADLLTCSWWLIRARPTTAEVPALATAGEVVELTPADN